MLVRDSLIAAVGTRAQVEALPESKAAEKLDLGGRVALPGFVDSHTHPAFTTPRLIDFEKRITGSSYEEIAAAGGGNFFVG